MQARFLLGPAGSGKTFRCLTEIRAALAAAPEGPPLILLAPKQATFQLERQLLADPSLPGYTRLHILSFERLADRVIAQLQQARPKLLSAEGRVMVLRALLGQKQTELKVFHASARWPGFARELGSLLRELQQYHLSAAKLASLAATMGASHRLHAKLHDLALILHSYLDWLRQQQLEDADRLLGLATEALRSPLAPRLSPFKVAGLWLDGFAEMTALELDLLAALIPCCERATLAFCLDGDPGENPAWLSPWAIVGQTFRRCYHNLAASPGCEVSVEVLPRDPERTRFADNPNLQHLEKFWARPQPFFPIAHHPALRLALCPNPEAEAVVAAREILRFVRGGRRFRDCAVLLRSLERHHDVLRRVFTRYEIPFFLDRREPVAHHPLAELTRFALRTVVFDWKQEDWFGALKTGLFSLSESELDRLENEALARGWQGKVWQEPLKIPDDASLQQNLERLRQSIVPPLNRLAANLTAAGHQPTGTQVSEALRQLWQGLQVEKTLDRWSRGMAEINALPLGTRYSAVANSVHSTVWQQMSEWLDSLALAFPCEALPLQSWLPILEAGLSGLTVGVVPPALDQVLIGTIDRSRNPDLHLAVVMGVNETIFPAPPERGMLLSEADRATLESQEVFLGPTSRQRLGHERYYGYIACTRARQRVVLTCATTAADGRPLNPSSLITHLLRLFPRLECERIPLSRDWRECEHASELVAPILQAQSSRFKNESLAALADLPAFVPALNRWTQLETARQATQLAPGVAQKIHGAELQTSVSGLEDFSACPFKFFVRRGLRAEERKQFEVDHRETGGFQHAVLSQFHRQLQARSTRWRDLTPMEARERIGQLGEALLPVFHGGVFPATAAGLFTARTLIERLQRLVETLIGWMPQYEFDPYAVEVEFGLPGSLLPGWRLDLGDGQAMLLRGRIDRVDLFRPANADAALAVVIDYKSSARRLDPVKLHYGLELQLLAYLGALGRLPDAHPEFQVSRLLPAGVFYVNLKGTSGSGASRTAVIASRAETRRSGYQHSGRFDAQELRKFDNRPEASKGDQFKYLFKANGELGIRGTEAMKPGAFVELLGQVENHLRRIGQEIYAGKVAVSPYRQNQETACDHCDYRPICRFDPWTEPYRVLRPPPKENQPVSGARRRSMVQPTI